MSLSSFSARLKRGGSLAAFTAALSFPMLAIAAPAPSGAGEVRPYQAGWGFDESGMNRNVRPGDNFSAYANGVYLKNLHIPADMSSYGPFNILAELSLSRQKAILEEARSRAAQPTDDMGKLGAYYAAYLDQAAVDRLGGAPLAEDLRVIRNVRDLKALSVVFGSAVRSMMFSTFMLDTEQNPSDPDRQMLVLDQGMSIGVNGGLGMPDISYYTDPKLAATKALYEGYIAKILSLENWPSPEENAANVVALETALAQVELPRDQTRDPLKLFNPMTVRQLQKLSPELDWPALFLAMGVSKDGLMDRKIDVREPGPIVAMGRVLAKTDMNTIQAWLAFHLGNNAAPYLSHDFSEASFAFNGKTLRGISRQPDRWKQGVEAANTAMGWALGRIYVARYFPPSAMQKITGLVHEVKASFRTRIEHNEWMDRPTRKAALKKLDHFAMQVGYPHKWRDYSALDIRANDVFGNAERSVAFNWQYRLSRLDKKVDRDEWEMTPQTVNAYYTPTMNEIVFPAAILQPPFFNPQGDMAVNYGGIGGVIGHEMSHGFDDQGRHYDGKGRLHDWWSPASSAAFDKLAKRLGAQYDAQEPLPGQHVNGSMTMGENIADLGGLNLALQAYRNSLKGKEDAPLHGWTGDQRVFLGWAQVWREKYRVDMLRQLVISNEHSPAESRVNMPAHNIDAWYGAFDVKPGESLYLSPEQRVKIW